jgi:hypothetical protein
LRKITHNISENTCKWIPLPPLNKEWNDDDIYKYFNLTEDDIKLIKETNIVGYKNIIENKIIENVVTEIKPLQKRLRIVAKTVAKTTVVP